MILATTKAIDDANQLNVNVENIIEKFQISISTIQSKYAISIINDLLQEPLELAEKLKFHTDDTTLENITFTCSGCGACCKKLKAGVSLLDIKNICDEKQYHLLPFIKLIPNILYFKFMNKGVFPFITHAYNPDLINTIKTINPSLVKIDPEQQQHCIFYNSLEKKCSIYDYRPLECKIYPIGNKHFNVKNILCNENAFTGKHPKNDTTMFARWIEEKRLADVALYTLHKLHPNGKMQILMKKLAVIFEYMGISGIYCHKSNDNLLNFR
ncbi:MAG: YkgJ family cysteine cluster protein [Promethearchaeota archaeon]